MDKSINESIGGSLNTKKVPISNSVESTGLNFTTTNFTVSNPPNNEYASIQVDPNWYSGIRSVNFRDTFCFRSDLDDLAESCGFTKVLEGLRSQVVMLTSQQEMILRLWEYGTIAVSDHPHKYTELVELEIEEFFVQAAIYGSFDIDTVIAISEISLRELVEKKFYELDTVRGLSKHFFKILEQTNYLDEWILDQTFIKYWMTRRQALLGQIERFPESQAFHLITYLLKVIMNKKTNK